MPELRRFVQVDVFTAEPLKGNPLAVVVDAAGLSDDEMAAFARWTNLSETTFLLPPTDPAADYRVRIFTPGGELPFAGHPTLGSAHAFLASGGDVKKPGEVVQQCAIGLVRVKRDGARLAFAAPPLQRSGPVDDGALHEQAIAALRIAPDALLDLVWVDNGPGWMAARLPSAAAVLALKPDFIAMQGLKLGVVGAHPADADCQFEVRGFPRTLSPAASTRAWRSGCRARAWPATPTSLPRAPRSAGRVACMCGATPTPPGSAAT